MEVAFERTGERRYAVRVVVPGQSTRYTNPAPGFDEHIPHDLVHYVLEAELHLSAGVYGRAAQGGSSFIVAHDGTSARQRSREQRRQRRREAGLSRRDAARGDMARAERLALLCDITWRRRRGARGDDLAWLAPSPPTPDETACVERVVDKLEHVARRWQALPVGGSLRFVWPSVEPI